MVSLLGDPCIIQGMVPANPEEDELILILRELEDCRMLCKIGKGYDEAANAALGTIAERIDNIESVIRSLSETQIFGPDELEIRHHSFTRKLKRPPTSQQDPPPAAT